MATCNLCGSDFDVESHPHDEASSCPGCGAIPRWRAVVCALSVALFGESMSISDFPGRPDLTGIGLSDQSRYAEVLSSKFAYRNTYYDREPQLDITKPPEELHGTLDFLIAADVFEHVRPPVERAFENSLRLLKPGGALILTAPSFPARVTDETREHYPNLGEHAVVDFNGRPILVNRTADGRWEVFDNLVYHGGGGSALEMRVFSHPSLMGQLRAAGFEPITDWTEAHPEFGLPWPRTPGKVVPGFPIVARRPGGG